MSLFYSASKPLALEKKQPLVEEKKVHLKSALKKGPLRKSRKAKNRIRAIQPSAYSMINTHPVLGPHVALLNQSSKESTDRAAVISLARASIARGFGSMSLYIATGGRTGIATNGAGGLIFSLPTGQGINMNLSSTTFPEITSIVALFDEVKVAGIHVEFNPVNPYNKGVATVSVPFGLFFDDEDGALAPTNSLTGHAAQVNRGPHFVEFSPDHSMKHTFLRSSPMSQYDWTPTTALGTEPSTFGSLYVTGDGTNTISTTYGYLVYRALLHCRMRN